MSLPDGWVAAVDPQGKTYYSKSQYEMPVDPTIALRAEFAAQIEQLRTEIVEIVAALPEKDEKEESNGELEEEVKALRVRVTRLESIAGVLKHEEEGVPPPKLSHAATVPTGLGGELASAITGAKPKLHAHQEPEEEDDGSRPAWMREAAKKKAAKERKDAQEKAEAEAEAKARARAEKVSAGTYIMPPQIAALEGQVAAPPPAADPEEVKPKWMLEAEEKKKQAKANEEARAAKEAAREEAKALEQQKRADEAKKKAAREAKMAQLEEERKKKEATPEWMRKARAKAADA